MISPAERSAQLAARHETKITPRNNTPLKVGTIKTRLITNAFYNWFGWFEYDCPPNKINCNRNLSSILPHFYVAHDSAASIFLVSRFQTGGSGVSREAEALPEPTPKA